LSSYTDTDILTSKTIFLAFKKFNNNVIATRSFRSKDKSFFKVISKFSYKGQILYSLHKFKELNEKKHICDQFTFNTENYDSVLGNYGSHWWVTSQVEYRLDFNYNGLGVISYDYIELMLKKMLISKFGENYDWLDCNKEFFPELNREDLIEHYYEVYNEKSNRDPYFLDYD